MIREPLRQARRLRRGRRRHRHGARGGVRAHPPRAAAAGRDDERDRPGARHRARPRAEPRDAARGARAAPATRSTWCCCSPSIPGWGGQKFIPATHRTGSRRARQMIAAAGREILLGVDGGITRDNIGAIAAAGADLVVTGSAVFDGGRGGQRRHARGIDARLTCCAVRLRPARERSAEAAMRVPLVRTTRPRGSSRATAPRVGRGPRAPHVLRAGCSAPSPRSCCTAAATRRSRARSRTRPRRAIGRHLREGLGRTTWRRIEPDGASRRSTSAYLRAPARAATPSTTTRW